jgi:hypothetical protein
VIVATASGFWLFGFGLGLGAGEEDPPGRTGWSLFGREKEGERDEEVEEGRRALVAVFWAREGEGIL